jgi:hypothetical protein
MTDSRQRRVDTLRQAARRKSQAKTKAAERACMRSTPIE